MKQRILQFWLSHIPKQGLEFDEQLDREWLSNALRERERDPFHPTGGLVVQGRIKRLGSQDILVTTRFSYPVCFRCPRCDDKREMEIAGEFEHLWMPIEKLQRLGSDGDQEEEAGYSTFEKEQIDIEPVLVEELLLSVPMFPVVEEDDEGCCLHCNRRIEEALALPIGIEEEGAASGEGGVDPRWAALKKIKL